MRFPLCLSLSTLALSLFSGSVSALDTPTVSKLDRRLYMTAYEENQVYPIYAVNGLVTSIVFAEDEKVDVHTSGFSTAWEFAARGREGYPFPWGNSVEVKNEKGCFFANFKPDEGNYTQDGNLITSQTGIYGANSNGLFDMAGNVAEWTSTVYTEAGVSAMSDINPELTYNAAVEDPYVLNRKSVRGGSWKDPISYIRSAWRTWEYQNQPRSYIGFRCVRSLATGTSRNK